MPVFEDAEEREELVDILDKLLELYVRQAEAEVGHDDAALGEIRTDIRRLEKRKERFLHWYEDHAA